MNSQTGACSSSRRIRFPASLLQVVSTAHGLKFPDFKVGCHRGALEDATSRYAHPRWSCPRIWMR
ncbi:hypothetical protein [Archangium violaceum]|uniref:hypothetical protein n=1 Tax=Archangium violaceum TaxID=83451 RepID=UPI00190FA475|nr:hypothetical protein [Archangium violaceum]